MFIFVTYIHIYILIFIFISYLLFKATVQNKVRILLFPVCLSTYIDHK